MSQRFPNAPPSNTNSFQHYTGYNLGDPRYGSASYPQRSVGLPRHSGYQSADQSQLTGEQRLNAPAYPGVIMTSFGSAAPPLVAQRSYNQGQGDLFGPNLQAQNYDQSSSVYDPSHFHHDYQSPSSLGAGGPTWAYSAYSADPPNQQPPNYSAWAGFSTDATLIPAPPPGASSQQQRDARAPPTFQGSSSRGHTQHSAGPSRTKTSPHAILMTDGPERSPSFMSVFSLSDLKKGRGCCNNCVSRRIPQQCTLSEETKDRVCYPCSTRSNLASTCEYLSEKERKAEFNERKRRQRLRKRASGKAKEAS